MDQHWYNIGSTPCVYWDHDTYVQWVCEIGCSLSWTCTLFWSRTRWTLFLFLFATFLCFSVTKQTLVREQPVERVQQFYHINEIHAHPSRIRTEFRIYISINPTCSIGRYPDCRRWYFQYTQNFKIILNVLLYMYHMKKTLQLQPHYASFYNSYLCVLHNRNNPFHCVVSQVSTLHHNIVNNNIDFYVACIVSTRTLNYDNKMILVHT